MIQFRLSEHAADMLRERNIEKTWVQFALDNPETKEIREDGTIHYICSVENHRGKYLRVVVNPNYEPIRVVTVFFDRRIRRTK